MKIIIVTTFVPFVDGGANLICDSLSDEARARGHQVETLRFPFHPQYDQMLDQMLALRLIDLTRHGDRLIAIRTPSYLLRHPRKFLWFIHHHRGAYDLWNTKYQDIPSTPEGLAYRNAIIQADNAGFAEAEKIFTNSHVVSARLKQFNNIESEVLYPPLWRAERYHSKTYGEHIVYVSRLTHHKRQWLAIEAMRHTKTAVKLVIIGKPDPDSQAYLAELESLVKQYSLPERVSIIGHWVSEEEKVIMFAGCLAAIYLPLDEDSYGYPALEAHHSNKAVISTTDSGGTRELIAHRQNGYLCDPAPESIARAMDELYLDRELARKMGEAGRRRIGELGIHWDNVFRKLLA